MHDLNLNGRSQSNVKQIRRFAAVTYLSRKPCNKTTKIIINAERYGNQRSLVDIERKYDGDEPVTTESHQCQDRYSQRECLQEQIQLQQQPSQQEIVLSQGRSRDAPHIMGALKNFRGPDYAHRYFSQNFS